MKREAIDTFLAAYASGNYSEQEHQLFCEWIMNAPAEERNSVADRYLSLLAANKENPSTDLDLIHTIEAAINASEAYHLESREVPAPRSKSPLIQMFWFRIAAMLIVLAGGAIFLYTRQNSTSKPVKTLSDKSGKSTPVATGAILTLADGRQVVLDSLGNGKIVSQDGSDAVMIAGQLAYNKNNFSSGKPSFNTITTPRGRQFQIVLSDGSRVWLNAETSLKYPTSFDGVERVITITGEALFDITADKSKPFIVKTTNADIKVLGTRFNVNAYPEQAGMIATLVEGSIQLIAYNNKQFLYPGQQYQVFKDGKATLYEHADMEEALAWQHGMFNFNNAGIQKVMEQLTRWYDIDVLYPSGVPSYHFNGQLPRDLSLQQILRALGVSEVRFRLEGRTLIIQ